MTTHTPPSDEELERLWGGHPLLDEVRRLREELALVGPQLSAAMLLYQDTRTRAERAEAELQRRSFAYGNAAIENPAITRELVALEAERLRAERAEAEREEFRDRLGDACHAIDAFGFRSDEYGGTETLLSAIKKLGDDRNILRARAERAEAIIKDRSQWCPGEFPCEASMHAGEYFDRMTRAEAAAQAQHDAYEAERVQQEIKSMRQDVERFRWLRENVSFYNTADGASPVLASACRRIFYHATDNVGAHTLEELADAALDAVRTRAQEPTDGD